MGSDGSPLAPLWGSLADVSIVLEHNGPGRPVAQALERVAHVADLLAHDPRLCAARKDQVLKETEYVRQRRKIQ